MEDVRRLWWHIASVILALVYVILSGDLCQTIYEGSVLGREDIPTQYTAFAQIKIIAGVNT